MENAHEILGVRTGATEAEIKKAFREGAKRTHPDLAGNGSEAEFKRLLAAYTALSAHPQSRTFRSAPPSAPKRAAPQAEPRGPTTVFHVGPSPFAVANAQYRTIASLPFLIFR